MDLPKPFFEVVSADGRHIQVNALQIAMIQEVPPGDTLIIMGNGERIVVKAAKDRIELAVSSALTKD
jgi:uncharacterized protein YlzI (FlbEa/FlbD family)